MSDTDNKPEKALKKVAIVGGGPSRRRAPYHNHSWEIWAFSSRLYRYPRITRWFELHAMTDLRQRLSTYRPGRRSYRGYMRFLRNLKCPVYMQRKHKNIPNSVVFPLKKVKAEFGRCFTSSASYLIALAILEGYDVIGLWGIDVRRKEYLRQRGAIKYLLGVAKKKGIKILIARGSRIRVPENPKPVRTRVLYAYGWRSPHAWWRYNIRRRLRLHRLRLRRLRKRRLRAQPRRLGLGPGLRLRCKQKGQRRR
ncbi:MAG TPA: hypothetical protein GXX29_03905 [Firmicutes bacterium]|nr:hypothetical protein [Bacillota bacterium]